MYKRFLVNSQYYFSLVSKFIIAKIFRLEASAIVVFIKKLIKRSLFIPTNFIPANKDNGAKVQKGITY